MAGIAAAIRDGRLSFGFLEAPPFRRWAVRSARTYRQVSQETGVPLELLGGFLEAIGFARMAPDGLIREDELEVVPLLRLGLSTGFLDQVWSSRLGRGYAEGLRLIASVEKAAWQAWFIAPVLAAGADQQTAREQAAQRSGDLNGRTVNLAARIAAFASASRVLVSEPVVQRAPPQGVTFVELGQVQLQGIAQPVRLLEARRA